MIFHNWRTPWTLFWSIVWNVSELTGIGLGKYAPWIFSQMINSKRTKANIKRNRNEM